MTGQTADRMAVHPVDQDQARRQPDVGQCGTGRNCAAICQGDAEAFPGTISSDLQPIVVPYQQSMGKTLLLLFLGVLLLLLIGCANCSLLLLARGVARQHEFAMRSALGASRWRMVRQLLVESMVISFAGTIFGVALSAILARLPIQLSPHSFPAESAIGVSPTVLGFSLFLPACAVSGLGSSPLCAPLALTWGLCCSELSRELPGRVELVA